MRHKRKAKNETRGDEQIRESKSEKKKEFRAERKRGRASDRATVETESKPSRTE